MRQHISRFGTRPTYASTKRSARSAARVEAVEPRILLATFTVTGTNDAGPGSLRECILAANANGGADTIAFSIGTGRQTIRPATTLPAVEGTTTIDGRTQPGWAGTPLIQIDGPGTGNNTLGLDVRGERSQLLDLSVTGFETGIRMTGDHQAVAGCYVGLDPAGAAGANSYGIELSANFATIGSAADANGGTVADGNVISGNSNVANFGFGLWVLGHGNTIVGNRIGTNPAGSAAVPNGQGVVVWGDGNHIGTPEAAARGERNVISGNRFENMLLEGADGTFIQGNYIGTSVTGYGSLGGKGIQVHQSADVTIGGTDPGTGNLISGNSIPISERDSGTVLIEGEASARATVRGNLIGTGPDGLSEGGNSVTAILVRGAPDAVIGGTTAAARNVIGQAGEDLIRVEGATAHNAVIQGNYVGATAALRGTFFGYGISVAGAPGAQIGGAAPGAGNVVAKCRYGIGIGGDGARVQGNYVGTNTDGTVTSTSNQENGIVLGGNYRDILIGGTGAGEGNLVSGYNIGVQVRGRGKTLAGNRIIGNLTNGVVHSGDEPPGAVGPVTVIGGTAPGAGNVISGNGRHGVLVIGEVRVLGNLIGLAPDGVTRLGNGGDGVRVEFNTTSPGAPMIGGVAAGEGNVIAYNNGAGVQIGQIFIPGVPPPNAAVLGNRIFSNGELGIDSGARGVTPNDMPDTAAGPQNHPVITSAVWGGGPGETGTHVVGTLDSEASTHFRIEFFSNREVDPTGRGEGATFIGAADVETDAAGHVDFDAALPATLIQDDYVTATATKVLLVPGPGPLAVRTSEFSAAVQAAAAPSVPPRVLYVGVSGEGWSPDFGNGLRGAYQVSDGAEQLGVLPWVNNNKIIIRFNRDVEIGSSNLTVRSIIDGRLYDNGRFDYDPVKHVATWTLEGPPLADRVRLDLPSGELGVRAGGPGGAGTQFDGEWDNGRDAYPSGDGSAGGDFHFRLNLLPGDATRDGRVDSLDLAYVKQRLNRTARNPGTGAVTYTPFADLNADGRINSLDLSAIKVWLNHSLPGGPPPASLTSPAPAPASVTRDWFVDVSILPV